MKQNSDKITTVSKEPRHYWVVSPNVKNNNRTVGEWRNASVREHAAFMGWGPDENQIGAKFADRAKQRGVKPNDILLIARRRSGEPEIVGFGVVRGKYATRLDGFKPPEEFGSLRMLSPFKPWSRAPSSMPFKEVLRYTQSLVQLHPDQNEDHFKVCRWMDNHLRNEKSRNGKKRHAIAESDRKPTGTTPKINIVDLPECHQLDYQVQTRSQAIRAIKIEAELLKSYVAWLEKQSRTFLAAKYGRLQCDGYERGRKNLIEAKSSTRCEHIRMAVGQLLDYAFAGEQKFGRPHMAILLPAKPDPSIEKWLLSLNIKMIWRAKGKFQDNANGQFL